MSLMTESLRRLAEARGGLGPDVPSPAAEEHPDREEHRPAVPPTAQLAAPYDAPSAEPPPEPAEVDEAASPPRTPAAAPEEAPPVRIRPAEPSNVGGGPEMPRRARAAEVPSAVAKLRDAILHDISRSGAREAVGKVVVIAGIQAEADALAAVASLGRAFAGTGGGEVLVMDASSPRLCESEEYACDTHGFTSLIDGTRKLQDVVESTPTPGMAFVRTGLAKGVAQKVDQKAVKLMIQDCQERFAYTLVNGGDWETNHLPLIARLADAFYVVIRSNGTDRDTAKKAVNYLDGTGVHIRGCILAGADGRVRRRA